MLIRAEFSYARGQSLGDYAAKARMHRALAARAARGQFPENAPHHIGQARYYASVCRAIRAQFPRVYADALLYFAVEV